jgi:hypothetical protein
MVKQAVLRGKVRPLYGVITGVGRAKETDKLGDAVSRPLSGFFKPFNRRL